MLGVRPLTARRGPGLESLLMAVHETSRVFHRRPLRRVRRQWRVLTVIAFGGGLGSVARYLLAQALPTAPGRFPWATFVTNVTGCLALGLLMTYVLEVWPPRRYVRPFWGIGFLGGYTTFSTYTVEIRALLVGGDTLLAGGYALASLVAGVAAVWLGVVIARLVSRRRVR
jgi:CrcB protein